MIQLSRSGAEHVVSNKNPLPLPAFEKEAKDWETPSKSETLVNADFRIISLCLLSPLSGCDPSFQCELDYSRFDTSEIICANNNTFGTTADPCYGHWSSFSDCDCVDPNGRLSSTGATYWCQGSGSNTGDWDSGLYSLECFAPCTINAGSNVIAENSTDEVVTIVKDGEYVKYSCPDGYTGIGTSQVTCSDGVWDDPTQFVCLGE
ncbi:hypothetical protein HOLleu_31968 [Holothuria leucospilota]|uniref:Sushi domain-containing protein n=1 Tax=Holothuria leucospilota TaxID=206669 RepID=A0A9Q1BI06_HOLLE|nr:hypothetical protein HOLleu_31968 [Holothuria leucospilota]